MSTTDSLNDFKDFALSTFASLVNRGKITVQQYEAAKAIIVDYSASWLSSDSSDILTLCNDIYQAMESGSLQSVDTEVKNDIAGLLSQIRTAMGNSENYGLFSAAKEQATEVAKQAGSVAENVSADIADMSLPYAVIGGALGFVAAPLLVATVPLATITVPIAGAAMGYSSKKIQNFAASMRAKVRGWF